MKTKAMNKKAKKRSLSETSVSIKPNKKQGNVNEFKKSPKKVKLAGFKQNGNSTSGEKTLISKVMDKQKKEQNKIVKQQSIVKPSETKKDKKENTKLTIVKPKEKIVSKTSRKKRIPYSTLNLTVEQITKKIEEIKSREVLSKRAKKILSILNRKLRACADSKKLDIVEKKSNQKVEHRADVLKNKQKANDKDKTKTKKKPVPIQSKKDKPQEKDEDDSDIEEESDEDESDAENKLIDSKKEEIDDESNEDEEDEEEVEDEEEGEDEEETEDEEDEENEESEEDEKDTIKKVNTVEVKKKERNNKNKQVSQSLDNQKEEKLLKEKRYILFVGNLPFNVTEDEIKQHFLTKVDTITNIRIPTNPDKVLRNYAYVEVTNNIDLKKGLSLNHTFLKNKKIIVEHSALMEYPKPDHVFKKVILSELQMLRKASKLADGNQKKKPFKKGKKDSKEESKTMK